MEKYAPFYISVGATAIYNGEERVTGALKA